MWFLRFAFLMVGVALGAGLAFAGIAPMEFAQAIQEITLFVISLF